ncbi:hypothetical protein EAS64_18745 [Trebonia kvetii]|uniref:Uncharacterized protein n=1 Tax=Trebonia kvetii TaxID=2480626 RepID=A0A6P2BZ95_9ACTN|nr:hypothetical protein [Trebonia kvetii]TVZ04404.1 hypothetical protein EAS64_18745 [Trebonia kvetii]
MRATLPVGEQLAVRGDSFAAAGAVVIGMLALADGLAMAEDVPIEDRRGPGRQPRSIIGRRSFIVRATARPAGSRPLCPGNCRRSVPVTQRIAM